MELTGDSHFESMVFKQIAIGRDTTDRCEYPAVDLAGSSH